MTKDILLFAVVYISMRISSIESTTNWPTDRQIKSIDWPDRTSSSSSPAHTHRIDSILSLSLSFFLFLSDDLSHFWSCCTCPNRHFANGASNEVLSFSICFENLLCCVTIIMVLRSLFDFGVRLPPLWNTECVWATCQIRADKLFQNGATLPSFQSIFGYFESILNLTTLNTVLFVWLTWG